MRFSIGLLAASLALSVGTAQAANVVSGKVWYVTDAIAQDASPANIPLTAPAVTFKVNAPFDFDTGDSGGTTLATFLASSGAFAIVGDASQPANNTFFLFEGLVSVVNGQQFTVTHDDGLTLTINGVKVVDKPDPTSPVDTTYSWTGATGTYAFQLVYAECCSGPAELRVDLPLVTPGAVPEPASIALLGAGLLGLGVSRRRAAR